VLVQAAGNSHPVRNGLQPKINSNYGRGRTHNMFSDLANIPSKTKVLMDRAA
jgi:hypothetical protein